MGAKTPSQKVGAGMVEGGRTFAEILCANDSVTFDPTEPPNVDTITLIATLYDMGSVGFED